MDSTKIDPIITLKQSLLKEREYSELSFLPNDFYKKIRMELAQLRGKQFDQTVLLLVELFRMRHSKIVQFASVMSFTDNIKKNLTDEEMSYYNTMNHLTEELKQKVTSVSNFCIYHYGKKKFGRKCLCGISFCDDECCVWYHTLECNIQKIHIGIPDINSLKI